MNDYQLVTTLTFNIMPEKLIAIFVLVNLDELWQLSWIEPTSVVDVHLMIIF